jgi:hypothetical protein
MCTRFDKLEALRKAAWESISKRREFEWRVSIAFWGLLAAFVAGFGTRQSAVSYSCSDRWLLAFFALLLGVGHVLWLCGLRRAYKIDKREEEAFREEMRQEAPFHESEEITDLRKEARKSSWNFTAQLITTCTIILLAIFVVLRF